jgi:hypothetical protein
MANEGISEDVLSLGSEVLDLIDDGTGSMQQIMANADQALEAAQFPGVPKATAERISTRRWLLASAMFDKQRDTLISIDPRSAWNPRLFVLTREALVWFKRPLDWRSEYRHPLGDESGHLLLRELSPEMAVTLAPPDGGSASTAETAVLKLSTSSKTYYVRADGADAAERLRQWMRAIKLAAGVQPGATLPYARLPALLGVEAASGVVAMGLLDKQRDGLIRGGWARRMFVLTDGWLAYFKCGEHGPHVALFGEERGAFALQVLVTVVLTAGADGRGACR